MPELSVNIGANIDGLNKAIVEAISVTEKGSKSIEKEALSIERSFSLINKTKFTFGANYSQAVKSIEKSSNETAKALSISKDAIYTTGDAYERTSKKTITVSKALADEAVKTSNKLGGSLVTGSNRATFALTNLGRVAQDAPFGFIGIQNNLNPLLESFQSLRKETGSNVGAFKALGSSLLGAGGIGLALSVVGAAVLLYQKYVQSSKKATEEAEKSNKTYGESLTGVAKSIFEANSASREEVSRLDLLVRTTKNLSLSVNERALAVKELQEKYPLYFKNLTVENALTKEAEGNYKKLKQAIVATALARSADKDTAKQGDVIFENVKKSNDIQKNINKLAKENADLQKRNVQTSSGGTVFGQAIDFNAQKIKQLKEEQKQYTDAIKNANTTIFNNNQLQDAIVRKFGVKSIVGDKTNKTTTVKSNPRVKLEGIDVERLTPEFQDKAGKEIIKKVVPYLKNIADKGIIDRQIIPVPISVDFVNPEITSASQLALDRAFEEYQPKFQQAFKGFSENAIPDAFVSFGDALASGGNPIEAFGQSVLGAFGNFLGEFGKLLIQYGVAGLAFSSVTKALTNPITAAPAALAAIGAGIALSVAGGAIKGFLGGGSSGGGGYQAPRSSGGVKGFATGVTNFSGGLAMVGELGPELVNLPTGSNVITNQNTKSLLKGGGSNNLNVNFGTPVLRGSDLYIAVQRGAKELGRTI